MLSQLRIVTATASIIALSLCATAAAQFPELVTDFETNREGDVLPFQPTTFGDLQVVMFQDPQEADVTAANIASDIATTSGLPSSEESFVANFVGDNFFGAGGTDQFLDVRFEWANSNGTRWALIETLDSPSLGDPAIHLNGTVTMQINFPNCSFEFPDLVYGTQIGVAILVRETGTEFPQGFKDVGTGDLEFVGVSSVADATGPNPIPVPAVFINVTDANCSGSLSDWKELSFDLDTGDVTFDGVTTPASIVGWEFNGGNGVLDATTNGDMVNRGVFAGLVLAVPQSDTTSEYLEFLVDQVEFDAPVTDPTIAPQIATPVKQGDPSVQVNDVLSRATRVVLEIDRSDGNNEDAFTADETFQDNDPLPDPATEDRYEIIPITTTTLAEGDRVRARQEIGVDISTNSVIIPVFPPAAFSLTLSLDEEGSLGQGPFEFVGALSVTGVAPQGHPVFAQNGVWQNAEFSLLPGIEPVEPFALGGNGVLDSANNGGSYNIDSLFFSIDPTEPTTGPYNIFLDRVYYIDANDEEVLIADAEVINPFPNLRGQSTSVLATWDSIISGLASYDGDRSNRLLWEFPDTAAGNTHSVYRPVVTFPDSAKTVGMWLLVEDARTNGLPLPSVEHPLAAAQPLVTVFLNTNGATSATLLVNGTSAGTEAVSGVDEIDIAPTVTLNVGDSVSAYYTTPEGDSDLAYARGVIAPSAPTLSTPIVPGQTSVTVNDLMTLPHATASTVNVFVDDAFAGDEPGGTATVDVTVAALGDGDIVTATQVVNGVESDPSAPVTVAVPPPTVVGPLDAGDDVVPVIDIHPSATTVTVFVNNDTYPINTTGVTNLNVDVAPLSSGDLVKARQTIAGIESADSNIVIVANTVVVNELLYDDSGADTLQFVELYNFGASAVDISGYKIVVGDTAPRYTLTIPASTTIASNDFWAVGQAGAAALPGASIDLVEAGINLGDTGFAAANGEIYVALRNPSDILLDAVAVETNKGLVLAPSDIAAQVGPGIFGNMLAAREDIPWADARWRDGADTDNNGIDWGLQKATPGYSNNLTDLTPYALNTDAMAPGTEVPNWSAYFAPPRAINPAVADALNPKVIPASPQGGNAFIVRDTPGGNATGFNTLSKEDFTLETYIYVAPDFLAAGSEEARLGVRGGPGGVHNYDDGNGFNGSTGLCWYFRRETGNQFAYLLDENDGDDTGLPIYAWANVLGSIDIETNSGMTGWQRLLIETRGDYVLGIFGGTYGSREDGIQIIGQHNFPGPGGVWITHRESVTGATDMRPITLDAYSLTTAAPGGDGDTDADTDHDLADFAVFQQCFGEVGLSSPCTIVDFDGNDEINLGDYTWFEFFLAGPS